MERDAATAALFTPLYTAVTNYFNGANSGIAAALEDVVKYMYNDLTRRTTVFENNFEMHCSSNYPTGYNDIRECFYTFYELLTISNSSFFSAFVYEAPESGGEGGGAATPVVTSNTLIDKWIAEISAAINTDLANVQALADWCKNSGGCCDLICLLENRGRVVEQKTLKEKAQIIYYDKKLMEVIAARGFSVYVPSYFK